MKNIVQFSGGKDSLATLIYVAEKYPKNVEAVFCDTGFEHDVTYSHIIESCSFLNVPLVVLKNDKTPDMLSLAASKGRFPSTKARFCTEVLKVQPFIDYLLSHQESVTVFQGIRKDESFKRSRMDAECSFFRGYLHPYGFDKLGKPKFHTYRKKNVLDWLKDKQADVIRPIFNFTSKETIDFILSKGMKPNPLYYQGFGRVGCFPCIMARHSEVEQMILQYPEYFTRLESYENDLGKTFFPPDYIPKHACTNRKFPTSSDVRKYLTGKAQTEKIKFENDDFKGCLSYYSLCE